MYDEIDYLKNFLNVASTNSANDSLIWDPYYQDPDFNPIVFTEFFIPKISPSVLATVYNEDEILLLQGKIKKNPFFMKYLEFEMNGLQ